MSKKKYIKQKTLEELDVERKRLLVYQNDNKKLKEISDYLDFIYWGIKK